MESNTKQAKGFLKTALFIALLLLVAALVFVIIRPYKVSYACLIAAAVLCVVILILLLIGRKKPTEEKAEPAPAPVEESTPEEEPAKAEAAAEEESVEEAAEESEPVAAGEGMGLKESLNIASHAHRAEKMSKAYISGYLRSVYPEKVELNERGNATATGLPLADTHYVTAKDGKKVCFVYVYETDGATMLLLKTKDALGKEMTKEHHSVRRSAFPKAKDAWYSVVVDDSLSNEQVEDMLDRTIALYTGEPVPKKVPAEAIGLKETLDIAAHAHRIEELTKPSIAQYLKRCIRPWSKPTSANTSPRPVCRSPTRTTSRRRTANSSASSTSTRPRAR